VGNPKGRPRGTRNRAGLLMEDLLDGRAKALTEKAIEKALTGDVFALREPALPLCCAECLRPSDDCPFIVEGCALDPAPRDRGAASTEKSIADGKAKPFRTAERQSRQRAAVL
jgi:hypothetical protein